MPKKDPSERPSGANRQEFLRDGMRQALRRGYQAWEAWRDMRQQVRGTVHREIGNAWRGRPAGYRPPRPINPFQLEDKPEIARELMAEGRYCRPPGALREFPDFDQACTRCGDCVPACPHGAIQIYHNSWGPLLEPNLAACHLCPDYPCVKACPEGALNSHRLEEYLPYFGRAWIEHEHCRRDRGDDCQLCAENCPVEGALPEPDKKSTKDSPYDTAPAIWDIHPEYCVGCGVCVETCPTFPKAIRVQVIAENLTEE